jgi:O-antigen/teichoic acid export membrane protein
VLNVLFNNLFVFLIGKYYSTKQTGYYSQSNKLSETFNFSFQAILVGSTYNLFTQIQHDNERFRRIFREIATKVSVVTFPVMISLIAMAKPLIFTLLGDKWLPSEHYFQLLCLASLFGPLYTLNINALNARGESRNTLIIEIIKKSLTIAVVILSFQYGIETMLCGYAAANFIAYAFSAFYLKKNLTHYLKHQLEDFIKSMLIGIAIAVVVFLLSKVVDNFYVLFALQSIVAVVIYLSILKKMQPALFENGIKLVMEQIKKFV